LPESSGRRIRSFSLSISFCHGLHAHFAIEGLTVKERINILRLNNKRHKIKIKTNAERHEDSRLESAKAKVAKLRRKRGRVVNTFASY
jgi:hypothetical protein